MARNVYQAFLDGGIDVASSFLVRVERELRSIMLLCGAKTIEELQQVPRVVTGELRHWIA
jgi:isopentenyl diphosphate isomerase/L-lactate dehydrogenase-like FMN-dependent dehydrogenase